MQEWLKNKKFVAVLVILAALLTVVFFGARFTASYYYKKGAEAYSQNNFVDAKSNFSISLIFGPKNPQTYFWLGRIALGIPTPKQIIYWPQADYKEMIKYHNKAISLGLEKKNRNLYRIALDHLGNAYWNLNELDKAREKYSEKLSKFPDSSFWARYFIAWHDFNYLNKPDEALETLLPAIIMAESDNDRWNLFRFHALLAQLYIYKSDFANAVKYAKLVIENNDLTDKFLEVKIAHIILALDYGRQKKFTLAESEIKKASSSDCFLALAYTVGENYSKAISIAEKTDITAQTFSSSVCLQVLAGSYLLRGDKVKAKKYMEEYLSFTEKLTEKSIFIMSNRQQFTGELLKIK
ncbi:MAG: hypothetical protein A3A98_04320 [Candidatus Staskawiczbacteria bacterium RIFCSPLOWO2_01_FULL_40_39]|uniref:Uncharacterized protein n=1 Tax=Candidatus Azambacteria bacterium RIFCSPHIGHO2_01_FULL_40_24 TaxID=1797301 RepID=A0A1F5B2I2_9BACT|nr:MAG: hypothetical protein A2819_00765 [Candidatus Azambacteria bacterium RIFCSPHIGHO2_01_FULL_40_24]OGZ72909.1 MAG: hypothetical protein A3A98_04320 [Candidatus Staskawiczbacteria bacterium RIFCSPLOWO2_01_FULL_40_39]